MSFNESNVFQVIFLYMYGVLLPFPKTKENHPDPGLFPKSTLQALKKLWKYTKGAKWVLSSTWRVRNEFIQDILNAVHEFGLQDFVFDDITDPALHSERQWEIQDWLTKNYLNYPNDHKKKLCWLALDDEELIEGETNEKFKKLFDGHVIKTKSDVGLTMTDVDLALSLWNKQMND